MNDYLILAIIAITPFYWLWRYNAALKARAEIVDDIDSFLGGDASEAQKAMIYFAFEDCTNSLMALKSLVANLLVSNSHRRVISSALEETGRKNKEFKRLFVEIIKVNVILSPLSYFAFGVLVLCILVLKLMFTLSLNLSKQIKDIRVGIESVYYKKTC